MFNDMQYLLESSVCLCVFYAIYFCILRKDTFFERNRYFLLFATLISLVLPLLDFSLGNQASLSNVPTLYLLTVQVNTFETQIAQYWSFGNWANSIYWTVALLLLLRLCFQFFTLFWFISKNPTQIRRGYLQIDTNGKLPTFSFFNYLFWDNSKTMSEAESDKILHHELKHIWDKHSYDIVFLEILKVFFWFNPVIYLYSRSLKFLHEFIADASVLRESDVQSYSKLMVKSLFKQLNLNLTHHFNQSEIRQRLATMRKKRSSLKTNFKLLLIFPFLIVLLFAFSGKIQEKIIQKPNISNEMNRFATAEGGLDNFYKALAKVLVYPKEDRQAGISGRVFVQFTVLKDGTLENFKIIKSLSKACDAEAIKGIQKVNVKWLPAKVDGKAVKQEVSVPISFRAD